MTTLTFYGIGEIFYQTVKGYFNLYVDGRLGR